MPSYIVRVIIWTKPNTIILHSAIDIIIFLIINIYRIQLTYSFIVTFNPMRSIIIRNINTTIISVNDMIWIFWIDPSYVMIGMHIFF